jgi:hypothetical protein
MSWLVKFGYLGDLDATARGTVIAEDLQEALTVCAQRLGPLDRDGQLRGVIIERMDGFERD